MVQPQYNNLRSSPLEQVAATNLVSVLAQAMQVSQFATEMFHSLHQETLTIGNRVENISNRVCGLSEKTPDISNVMRNVAPDCFRIAPMQEPLRMEGQSQRGLFVHERAPAVERRLQTCKKLPPLDSMNEFAPALMVSEGKLNCSERYSNPKFFFNEWEKVEAKKQQVYFEKLALKEKRKLEKLKQQGKNDVNIDDIERTYVTEYGERITRRVQIKEPVGCGTTHLPDFHQAPTFHRNLNNEIFVEQVREGQVEFVESPKVHEMVLGKFEPGTHVRSEVIQIENECVSTISRSLPLVPSVNLNQPLLPPTPPVENHVAVSPILFQPVAPVLNETSEEPIVNEFPNPKLNESSAPEVVNPPGLRKRVDFLKSIREGEPITSLRKRKPRPNKPDTFDQIREGIALRPVKPNQRLDSEPEQTITDIVRKRMKLRELIQADPGTDSESDSDHDWL